MSEPLMPTCHSPAPRRRRCQGWPLCRPHCWRSAPRHCPHYSCQPQCSWRQRMMILIHNPKTLTWTCSRSRCWCRPQRRSGYQWCPTDSCRCRCLSPSLNRGKCILLRHSRMILFCHNIFDILPSNRVPIRILELFISHNIFKNKYAWFLIYWVQLGETMVKTNHGYD